MTDPQRNKLSMVLAVLGVLESNNTIWSGLTAFATLVESLDALSRSILLDSGIQGTPKTGVAGGKNRKQLAMIEDAAAVIGDVHAVAVTNQDDVLMAKSDVEVSDLVNMSDTLVGPYCRTLHTLGMENAAAIALLGTTAQDLSDLDAAIVAYLPLVTTPRQAISGGTVVTGDIKTDVKLADTLLKRQMDKSMLKFKKKNANFYMAYKNARIIVDLGGSGTAGSTGQTPLPAPAPVG